MSVQPLPSDSPIEAAGQDLLDRSPIAAQFAQELLALDASRGAVVGVVGPWGSGKTSFTNLVREQIARNGEVAILDFNPWMFSGATQLVDTFFSELSAQLKVRDGRRFRAVAETMQHYAEVLSPLTGLPVVGPWVGRYRFLADHAKKSAQVRERSALELKKELDRELAKLSSPLLVVVDDLDRLTSQEIRDVFKLVRLTASLSNLIYLLCFDRQRVEASLSEDGFPGSDYLEKILQLTIDLPVASRESMAQALFDSINSATDGVHLAAPFDENALLDITAEVILPLTSSVRDVRRYANAVRLAARTCGDFVNLTDLLALESIRVFLPSTFALLADSQAALTTTSNPYGIGSSDDALAARITALLDSAGGDQRPIVERFLRRVFPAAIRHLGGGNYGDTWLPKWLSARRAAHPEVLRSYLLGGMTRRVKCCVMAEHIIEGMVEDGQFSERLARVDPSDMEDVVDVISSLGGTYPLQGIEEAVGTLLDLNVLLPQRPLRMGDFGHWLPFTRAILFMLEQVGDRIEVERIVSEVLPTLPSLTAKMELVRLVGYGEGSGHELVTRGFAQKLDRDLREAIRATDPAELSNEEQLSRLLRLERSDLDAGEQAFELPLDQPKFSLAVLRSFVREVRSASTDSRAVFRERRLSWSALVDCAGTEDAVRSLFESALRSDDVDHPQAAADIELVRRHLDEGLRQDESF